MAQSCHTLWQSRNTCRHGHDLASSAQIQAEQAHREIRFLYTLRDKVQQPDRQLFQITVEERLAQPTLQLRSWIQHNKKLICHSVRIATAQLKLKTHRIQSFFPANRLSRSITSKRQGYGDQAPKRQRPSRISQFFPPTRVSISRRKTHAAPVPSILRPTIVSTYFSVIGISQSRLPRIDENQELVTNTVHCRQLCRRGMNIPELYPDHPG
jgi:hypothetical protein